MFDIKKCSYAKDLGGTIVCNLNHLPCGYPDDCPEENLRNRCVFCTHLKTTLGSWWREHSTRECNLGKLYETICNSFEYNEIYGEHNKKMFMKGEIDND